MDIYAKNQSGCLLSRSQGLIGLSAVICVLRDTALYNHVVVVAAAVISSVRLIGCDGRVVGCSL